MAEYLRYVIRTIEPIRIADDNTSQSGQTNTLRYIPGTTIRGLVINTLAKDKDFEEIKELLFSHDIAYLNAYPMAGEKELFPSPKGFYEDKVIVEGKKKIQNVVIKGDFEEGYKRASLGRYCYIEQDCVYYYNVDTGSDMKIKINLEDGEKQTIFRNEYMVPGQLFCGYIRVNCSELKDRIQQVFYEDIEKKDAYKTIRIGNARSAGFGKCKVLECKYVAKLPYEEYLPTEELQGSCYMLLLSNTAMRKETGELCGIDEKQLSKKFGVTDLKIKYCSTSTVNVRGYNRIWQTKIPSVLMFEQGSVFHLKFNGSISPEHQKALCNSGIGIHINEGCGRLLFLRDYEIVRYKLDGTKTKNEIVKKQEEDNCTRHKEDEEVLKMAAKQYYVASLKQQMEQFIVKESFSYGTISSSQLNKLNAVATAYRYCPKEAKRAIENYLEHAMKKEKTNNAQKERASFLEIKKFVEKLFSMELEQFLENTQKDTIMGVAKKDLFSEEEKERWKLKLLTELIRYENKKGNK